MKTERLYEFLILSKTLNFSKAARALYISQPVLTKHIQKMEQELNVTLFYRTTHGVSLTEAGQLLSRKSESLIDHCDAAANLTHLKSLSVKGTVQISCSIELAYSSHIQIFIDRFIERYPDIQVDFEIKTEGTPEEIIHRPCQDIVFTPCEYPNLPSDICRHLIQRHGTYAVLFPRHRLLSRSTVTLRELEGETFVVPLADELFGPYAKNWILTKRYTHDRVRCIKVQNLPTALFYVSIGKGIAIIPRYAKNLVSGNVFLSKIANDACCFHEFMYYNKKAENEAAELFYEEFCRAYPSLP